MQLRWSPSYHDIQQIIKAGPDQKIINNHTVRVLSQNTQCHYGDKYAPSNFEERLTALLNKMDNFDIVLLQELLSVRVFGVNVASWRYWVVDKARQRGFLFNADARPNVMGIDNGCLILSRYPILQCHSMDFTDSSKTFSIKGAIKATIEVVQNHKIEVVCLHMDAHSASVRQKQWNQLVSCLDLDTRSCIIAGDFNIEVNSSESHIMISTLPTYTCPISDWLDYIFVSPSLRHIAETPQVHSFRTEKGQNISDHNGVSVTLSFPKNN